MGLSLAKLEPPEPFDPRAGEVEFSATAEVRDGGEFTGLNRLVARFEVRQGGGIPVRTLSADRLVAGAGKFELRASWDGADGTGRVLPSDAFEVLVTLRLEDAETDETIAEVLPERGHQLAGCVAERGCVPVVSCATADDDPARCAVTFSQTDFVCNLLGGLVPPVAMPGWNFSGTGDKTPIALPFALSPDDRYPPNAAPGGNPDNADNPLIVGTDLGSPFEHVSDDGKREMVFLFGDTKPLPERSYAHDQDGNVYPNGSVFLQIPSNDDAMAVSHQEESDPPTGPDRCLDLAFFHGDATVDPIHGVPESELIEPVTMDGLLRADTQALTLSGIDLGFLRVPGPGFSIGGKMYSLVPALNDPSTVGVACDPTRPCAGNDECIAGACYYGDCSHVDGSTPCFKRNSDATFGISPAGDPHFRSLTADEAEPGALDIYRERSDIIPMVAFHPADASTLYVWGRKRILGHPDDIAQMQFWKHDVSPTKGFSVPEVFSGCNDDPRTCDEPKFTSDAAKAVRLYDEDRLIVNQATVTYLPAFGRWVMLYGGRLPLFLWPRYPSLSEERVLDPYVGIYLRTAPHPWGPWSSAITIYNPYWSTTSGYCEILFQADEQTALLTERIGSDFVHEECDSSSEIQTDPYRSHSDYGAEYGSAILPRFIEDAPDHATLSWLMSTWNPYRVVVMRTRLAKQPD